MSYLSNNYQSISHNNGKGQNDHIFNFVMTQINQSINNDKNLLFDPSGNNKTSKQANEGSLPNNAVTIQSKSQKTQYLIVQNMIFGKSVLGQLLRKDSTVMFGTLEKIKHIGSQIRRQQVYQNIISYLIFHSHNVILVNELFQHEKRFLENSQKYLKRIKSFVRQKKITTDMQFDFQFIKTFCTKQKEKKDIQKWHELIIDLYKKCNQEKDAHLKYLSFQLIQKLIIIHNRQLYNNLCMERQQKADQLVQFHKLSQQRNLKQLELTLKITQNMTYSKINLQFDKQFNLQDISYAYISELLYGIDRRLLYIMGSYDFIILHNISQRAHQAYIIKLDNKNKIQYQCEQNINTMINNCSKDSLYDVVIISSCIYDDFKIPIRYLNFINLNPDVAKFELHNPQSLISITIANVKIINLNSCDNIQNICSKCNKYHIENFSKLNKIKRIYSWDDKCEQLNKQNVCLLNYIFMHNYLEYVFIHNIIENNNIIGNIQLSQHISGLRFIYIITTIQDLKVTLDINNEIPSDLRVFSVIMKYSSQPISVVYQGSEKKIAKIKENLIPI